MRQGGKKEKELRKVIEMEKKLHEKDRHSIEKTL